MELVEAMEHQQAQGLQPQVPVGADGKPLRLKMTATALFPRVVEAKKIGAPGWALFTATTALIPLRPDMLPTNACNALAPAVLLAGLPACSSPAGTPVVQFLCGHLFCTSCADGMCPLCQWRIDEQVTSIAEHVSNKVDDAVHAHPLRTHPTPPLLSFPSLLPFADTDVR